MKYNVATEVYADMRYHVHITQPILDLSILSNVEKKTIDVLIEALRTFNIVIEGGRLGEI